MLAKLYSGVKKLPQVVSRGVKEVAKRHEHDSHPARSTSLYRSSRANPPRTLRSYFTKPDTEFFDVDVQEQPVVDMGNISKELTVWQPVSTELTVWKPVEELNVVPPYIIINEVLLDAAVKREYFAQLGHIVKTTPEGQLIDPTPAANYLKHALEQWDRKRNKTKIVSEFASFRYDVAAFQNLDDDLNVVLDARTSPEGIVEYVLADAGVQKIYAEYLLDAVKAKNPEIAIAYLENAFIQNYRFRHKELKGERPVVTDDQKKVFREAAEKTVGESSALKLALREPEGMGRLL